MGAFKEIYDESVYLPDEPSNQLELGGALDALAGPLLSSNELGLVEVSGAYNIAPEGEEVPTPIKPLRLHAGWFSL